MRSIISWTVRNMPAMNTLVAAILIVGHDEFCHHATGGVSRV
jgi:hypothetical protein